MSLALYIAAAAWSLRCEAELPIGQAALCLLQRHLGLLYWEYIHGLSRCELFRNDSKLRW